MPQAHKSTFFSLQTILVGILVILSILPFVDLFHPGLPVTHDGVDHVARIANFYESLREGNIVPRWAANLNWGYGHPILMFLYPLPSYVASLFHGIGFSYVDSTKLVFAVSYVASIFGMYVWGSTAWGVVGGFIAALLYGYGPYRFVDLYIRGAIGEHVAFVFPPFIFYFLYTLGKYLEDKRPARTVWMHGLGLSVSLAALVLSHNAVSLMFLPIIVLYALYVYIFKTQKNNRYVWCVLFFLGLGMGLSAFFWGPAFLEGKYTLRDIVTKGDFRDRFVPVLQFFYSPWSYGGGNQFTKELGVLGWLVIASSLWLILKTKEQSKLWFSGVVLVVLISSLVGMTKVTYPIWQTITILQKFQFPWRLLTVSVFAVAVLGAIVGESVPKAMQRFVLVVVVIFTLLSTSSMWRAKQYVVHPESFYAGIYEGTTDTGESSPIWSIRFMEKRPLEPLEVIEGNATYEAGSRTTTRHTYRVDAVTNVRLVENTLYFPGWKIFVDGKQVPLQFQDPNYRGLMTFWIAPGTHEIIAQLGESPTRLIAGVVSITSIIVLFGSYMLLSRIKL